MEQPVTSLAGSEYLEMAHDLVAGLPAIDLAAESRLQRLILASHAEGLLLSAHDCAEGGLLVTLAESALAGGHGFASDADFAGRLDAALFGETQGRVIVSTRPASAPRLQDLARQHQVPLVRLGTVTGSETFSIGPVQSTLDALREANNSSL